MRSIVRAIRQVRSASRLRKGDAVLNGFGRRRQRILDNPVGISSFLPSSSNELDRCLHHAMISRALYTPAAKETSEVADVGGGGPLAEYERRIAAGELVDGDSFQVDILRALQRLYDELVESADTCRLDRYAASEKAGRSRWLWTRFLPQSSYSPVKGLYLYGGVGTGKTMMMDLFYEQFMNLKNVNVNEKVYSYSDL